MSIAFVAWFKKDLFRFSKTAFRAERFPKSNEVVRGGACRDVVRAI